MFTKQEIRQQILKQRRSMTEEQVQQLSEKICSKIIETKEYEESNNICIYMAISNEVDLTMLAADAMEKGKALFVPKTRGNEMDFVRIMHETSFVAGSYGIMEPVSDDVLDPVAGNETTLIVMPGVAFSVNGDRIGHGGGYYDRYLSELIKKAESGNLPENIITAAVCYDFQIAGELPSEAHDIKPKLIISESNHIVRK